MPLLNLGLTRAFANSIVVVAGDAANLGPITRDGVGAALADRRVNEYDATCVEALRAPGHGPAVVAIRGTGNREAFGNGAVGAGFKIRHGRGGRDSGACEFITQQRADGVGPAERFEGTESEAPGFILQAKRADPGLSGEVRKIAQRRRCVARPGCDFRLRATKASGGQHGHPGHAEARVGKQTERVRTEHGRMNSTDAPRGVDLGQCIASRNRAINARMVQLVPLPFGVLVSRLFRELEQKRSAFDLPAQRFVKSSPGHDLSVAIHRHRAATPFGPAAGPHTQMAQNIVLSWLAGGRVIECKTVQVKDDLTIPRPCIDMGTVGFNVEWSQELTLEQSLEEYVKGSMLIEMLKASGLAPGLEETVFDMSVGYDLAGIRSDKVGAFLAGMMDATEVIERLRAQIPDAWRHLRELPFASRVSDTLTLSTFHGCPPEEIESIARFLLTEIGIDVVVKLNPTLLGREELNSILHARMGYSEIKVPDAAFAKDASWDQVTGLVERLGPQAEAVGRGFGVKFSNTLVVENHKSFFPSSEQWMYLSGPPLHPLAIALVRRFRRSFGDRFPISFSAGVDEVNFADVVGLGLQPVTVCTNLLKHGGYRRGWYYIGNLVKRMDEVGAADIDGFVLRAHGQAETALAGLGLAEGRVAACRAALASGGDLRAAAGDAFAAWVSAARILNTEVYADHVLADRRYSAEENATPPNKVGSHLVLFDCLTCDKCIPICPNDANFSFVIPPGQIPIEQLVPDDIGWTVQPGGALTFTKPRQIGTFADVCNECGHCDVLCPEDGGPYLVKPLFFGSVEAWAASPQRDGFVLENSRNSIAMRGRFSGHVVRMERSNGLVRYTGDGFDVVLDPRDAAASAKGEANGPVDLTWLHIMDQILTAVTAPKAINYVNTMLELEAPH